MEQNREPRNKLMHKQSTEFDKSAKNTHGGKRLVSSTNGVGKTGYLHAKE